jgi:hypothetical protein
MLGENIDSEYIEKVNMEMYIMLIALFIDMIQEVECTERLNRL